jgi:hypothetical protein
MPVELKRQQFSAMRINSTPPAWDGHHPGVVLASGRQVKANPVLLTKSFSQIDARQCHGASLFVAALTMATMPARTASGTLPQRSTSRARSADFRAKTAKQDAKFSSPLSDVLKRKGLEESMDWF